MSGVRLTVVVAVFGFCAVAMGADWPTYQHDFARSGISEDRIELPLHEVWRYRAAAPPQPAWPEPAVEDVAVMGGRILRPRTVYDRAFHTTVSDGLVYFGSSADDRIVALDAATGAERWSYVTGGPVRLAPTVFGGRVYAGSDDGYLYCLDAKDGRLVWKYSPAPDARLIPGNGRIISACPVRTGAVVTDGVVYFGAGLFPEEGVYLCALDAATGAEIWKTSPDPMDFIRRFTTQLADRRYALSPQGYLLSSLRSLYIPTGRTSPVAVDFKTGEVTGMLECPGGEGGTYALLTPDTVVSGPGTRLSAFDAATQEPVATFPGRCMIVDGEMSYLLSDDRIAALDRAKYRQNVLRQKEVRADYAKLRAQAKRLQGAERSAAKKKLLDLENELNALQSFKFSWERQCDESYSMILAGGVLLLGSQDKVTGLRASDGELVWAADVEGKVYGLAAADGRVLVSTDKGVAYCFGPDAAAGGSEQPEKAAPPADPAVAEEAAYIIETAGMQNGYCLELGCRKDALAGAIARASDFKVVAVCEDEQQVEEIRARLVNTGLYGTKLAAMSFSLKQLPFTDYIADVVVVSEDAPRWPADEILRVLRPYGGLLFIRRKADAAAETWAGAMQGCEIAAKDEHWLVLRRGGIEGAGEWTHQYAEPGNTACSGDALAFSRARLQWFGLPGPRPMVDRHHRAMPPLVKNGRLFVPADNRVIAVNAYNGAPLWQLDTPDNRRLANQRDSGHMATADDLLYVRVHDECRVLDAATGEQVAAYRAPQLADGKRHWGYIAVVGDYLLGSGQRPDASYTTMSKLGDFEIQWGDFKRLVTSDYLFCMNRHTGEVLWTRGGGLYIHPAIAADSGRLYFIESHTRTAEHDVNGRSKLDVLWNNGPTMAAVELATGEPVWEAPVDFTLCQHIVYLSYARDTLVVTGSGNREGRAWYYLYGFDAADGQALWRADHPNNKGGIGGDHGEQVHHPVIVGDVVYAEPAAYGLRTGQRLDPSGAAAEWAMERREACGTLSAGASCLFYRDGHPSAQDIGPEGPRTKLNHVTRPGCWINMIPAGGLILIPEASSGCSCPYPLQASLAYLPVRR